MSNDLPPLPTEGEVDQTSTWLGRCEGFRVYTPDGSLLGYVEELEFGEDFSRPRRLSVRGCTGSHRVLVVPVETVAAIDPRAERIVLTRSPVSASFLEELTQQARQRLGQRQSLTPRAGA